MDAWTLRLIIVVLGALVLGLIYWHGARDRHQQGRRVAGPGARAREERREPGLGDTDQALHDGIDPELHAALSRLSQEISDHRGQDFADQPMIDRERHVDLSGDAGVSAPVADRAATAAPSFAPPPESHLGARQQDKIDRIVTLFVCMPEGETMRGTDIVVAAEKTGLTYGHLGIFHSLIPGKLEQGPIFSVANMVKPGHFDMAHIQELRTAGLTLFMALPGPLRALDAWDSMFPIANRLAELLGAQVLDESRNALGRQRIQYLRDELRAYDREQDKNVIKRPW